MSEDTMNTIGDEHPFTIKVRIAPDYLKAYVTVDMHDPLAEISTGDIQSALAKKNVSFGIDNRAVEQIAENPLAASDVLVATGAPYSDGVDGTIQYFFDEKAQSKPSINEDGSVDFKNMNFLMPAKIGQLLATRTMPTSGKNGTLVTGKLMKGKDGKIVNFKIGKNVYISDDGLNAISAENGSIKFNLGVISVMKSLDIQGDVGLETGNIVFSGKVSVSGNVLTGYSIKATDDVVINGLVEGALIETDGNLTINRGVQGNDQAVLKVEGDLVVKFLSGAEIECKGNIEADAIMHSTVNCAEQVIASGKRGIIVGGDVFARKGVEAKQIGSEMGTKTSVRVGLDPRTIKTYQDLQDEKTSISSSIKKIDQVLGLLRKQAQATGDKSKAAVMKKSMDSKEEYKQQLAEIEDKLNVYAKLIELLKKSDIRVSDVYPGVRLKLGNSFFSVKDRMLDSKFVKENSEVVMKSWDKNA